ncbi:MAG: LacI family DNA-binding transcriptional regulator [Actinobacteria bacterium]|nr:LacI family DNA-binding transcriptional regulator [Actinomycetota bacterium]
MTEQPHTAVTIYDVAKAAGVAPSTVSRTFARPGRVNADTAARIRRIADELGYRANPIGQALSTSQTRLIGLMVSDVANPFYSQLIRGTQLAATEAGYEILLADSRESGTRERTALERLVPVVEGFVIGSSRMSDSALRNIAKQRPMVVLNRALLDVPSVVTDNAGGMRAAVELLRELGHDSVVYVAGPEASWPDGMRFRALRDLGTSSGLGVQKVGPFLPTFEGGLAASRVLLERLPTAVIAYNDLMAIGVMHGFLAEGVRIPEQVSVIGFDDILISRLVLPSLTTVAAPMRQMGATAVNNVVALIKGARHRAEEAMVMPVQLKVRGSTGQRRRKRVSPALGTTMVSGSAS